MTIEQIVFVGALPAHFRIKVEPAGGEAARFEDFIHHQRVLFDAVRELVGIPAQLRIAAVGVNGAEQPQCNGRRNFMMERMAGERRVVSFNIQFNLFFQTKLFEEAVNGRGIIVILMLGRLLRFGLNQQRAFKADFMLMLHHQLHKAANLLTLLAQVGIQQGFIALATAPQNIVFTAQLMGGIHGGDHLGGRPAKYFRIRVGGRAGAVARVGKAVCGPPQKLHAALLLFLSQHLDHPGEVIAVLLERSAFRRDVNVVEAVVRHVEFMEEFERHIGFAFGHLQGVARLLPGTIKGAHAKHIGAIPAEGVPVTGRKTQMIFHPFAQHQFIRVVMTESQRVSGFRAFVTNAIELIEIGLHRELHIQRCGE